MATFIPPTADLTPPIQVEHRGPAFALFRHYKSRACGKSVLKIDGTYTTVVNPTVDQINAATEVYLGGHVYEVSDAVATALAAAGYGGVDTSLLYPAVSLYPDSTLFPRSA